MSYREKVKDPVYCLVAHQYHTELSPVKYFV